MRESVRDNVSLCPSLDPIISNCAGSVQRFLDVSDLKDLATLLSA
jgi:hypothetical protein